jgi:ribosomal protein S21
MINISIKLNNGNFFNKENIDFALKRLKNKMDQEEILETVKRKRSFETPKQIKIRKTKRLHRKIKESKNNRY